MLWPLARSAAELVTAGQLDRVKQCPVTEGGCGWLFLDETQERHPALVQHAVLR
jgi:predicted RNA-binding Zn ribbon-like protein